jgi:Ni/Fe-hydrogenase b-type cytochrome subunit
MSPPTSRPLGAASATDATVAPLAVVRDDGEPRHHWIVRVTHWVNALALTVMVGSGLRIFNAYPAFARKGESFCCWPWEGQAAPKWATFGGWLAGARHWHFAAMWVLVVNGLVYLTFIYRNGAWRDVTPRRGDLRDIREMLRFYFFLRREHPRQGKHNALQRATYFVMPWIGVFTVLTGLAIWKPVSLGWLTAIFGGYAWARYWHFVSMLVLVVLSFVHIFMILAVDPYSLRSMTTGGYSERLSPEARNARPFYHLLPRWGRWRAGSVARVEEHQPRSPDDTPDAFAKVEDRR